VQPYSSVAHAAAKGIIHYRTKLAIGFAHRMAARSVQPLTDTLESSNRHAQFLPAAPNVQPYGSVAHAAAKGIIHYRTKLAIGFTHRIAARSVQPLTDTLANSNHHAQFPAGCTERAALRLCGARSRKGNETSPMTTLRVAVYSSADWFMMDL